MKKRILLSGVVLALLSPAANADSFNLTIGEPAPVVYAEPVVQPQVIVLGGEHHLPDPHHGIRERDEEYWRHRRHAEEERHDEHEHR